MKTTTRNLILLAAGAFLLPVPSRAQDAAQMVPPKSAMERKNRAPVAKETLRVRFPKPQEFTLPNGMKVMILEDHKLPTVSMSMRIAAGSFFEPAEKQGLASMVASMLSEGILISGYIGDESRILYKRHIAERVRSIAPFLAYDEDPYLVVAGGRLYWMYDAYTYSNTFPYSKPMEGYNYMRNSVKIVIDAYTGETRFYAYHPERDPLVRTYAKIFPNLFLSADKMPEKLRAHVRYPQDLFDLQAQVYSTYHMEDPQVFYNKEDLWNIASEKLEEKVVQMESYYAIMRLPGEKSEEFIQMIPYTPNKRDNMIAWLCARSDGENYGKMLVYNFPKQEQIFGPMQIIGRMNQDPVISQQLTLWNQQGSSVYRGNLLVIPIKNEIIYVQPVYLQATSGKIPELKRIIVAYHNRLAMEPTLEAALLAVFQRRGPAAPTEGSGATSPTNVGSAAPRGARDLARSAVEQYNRAIEAQKRGEWARYGEEIDKLKRTLDALVKESEKK